MYAALPKKMRPKYYIIDKIMWNKLKYKILILPIFGVSSNVLRKPFSFLPDAKRAVKI